MRLLLVLYAGESPDRITDLLDRHPVDGYTMLPGALGAGETGRRMGTRAWPGGTTVFFSIVPEDAEPGLVTAVQEAARTLPPGERLHVAVMPVSYAV